MSTDAIGLIVFGVVSSVVVISFAIITIKLFK